MQTWRVDHVVISHVCYYGRDNSYPRHCVKTYPGKFAAIGLLVGTVCIRLMIRRMPGGSSG